MPATQWRQLRVLKKNKAKAICSSTLGGIWKELDCQPGDIPEYVADNADGEEDTRPAGILEK